MKKIVLSIIAVLYCIVTSGQAIHIFHDGEKNLRLLVTMVLKKLQLSLNLWGQPNISKYFIH